MEITLNTGAKAHVDEAWFEVVSAYSWCELKPKGSLTSYAITSSRKGGTVLMHRLVMSAAPGQCVDHEDQDGLNNRRHNLRFLTYGQNQMNRGLPANNTSGTKGVSWDKRRGLWRVEIGFEGKKNIVGTFSDLEEARAARVAAELTLYGPMLARDAAARR